MRRFRYSIRGSMIAVAVIALILSSPEFGMLALILSVSMLAIRCLMVAPGESLWRRRAKSYLVTIACVYTPFAWLLTMAYPWDSYRWLWFKMWPILPGIYPAILCTANQEPRLLWSMSVFTLLLIALFTWLGSLGRVALVTSGVITLVVSGFESWVAYQLFLW